MAFTPNTEMEVIDKEDLDYTDYPVVCRFCGDESVVRVRYVEVDDFIQTFSEVSICCQKSADIVNGDSVTNGVSRN